MATFKLRDRIEDRTFEVRDAPNLTRRGGSLTISPDIVVAHFINDVFTWAQVHGANVKKDGALGANRHDVYINPSYDEVPEWLQSVVDFNFMGES